MYVQVCMYVADIEMYYFFNWKPTDSGRNKVNYVRRGVGRRK